MTNNEQITAAVRDYFEGWYDADTARMDRALHHNLVKRSHKADRILTKDAMVEMTGNGDGCDDGKDRTLTIHVHDVHEGIANVTVESAVYREYVQLVQTDAGWKIVGTLWQFA